MERETLNQIQLLNEAQEQRKLEQELSKHVYYDIQALMELDR